MHPAILPLKRTFFVAIAAGTFFVSVAPALAQDGTRGAYAWERDAESPGREKPARQSGWKQRTDWWLSLEAVTNAPVDIGARVTAETPFRLRVSTGFGFVPGVYLGLVNDALSGLGAYDDETAGIIDGSIEGGSVWRTQVGFRPFPREGFYVDAGYALVNLSGSIYGSDVSAPDVIIGSTSAREAGYQVHTTLHMWLVELGWNAHLFDRMVLGVGLGVQGTISANTDAEPNFEQGRSATGRSLSAEATQNIDDVLERYGYVPTLTLRVGYDFL